MIPFIDLQAQRLRLAGKIEAAPAQLCRAAGRDVAESRTNKPGAGSAMPGVQMMIVTCSAA